MTLICYPVCKDVTLARQCPFLLWHAILACDGEVRGDRIVGSVSIVNTQSVFEQSLYFGQSVGFLSVYDIAFSSLRF